jgi:predicted transcriptional regulator
MKTANCSDLMKLSIPAVRYALAKGLSERYGMDQSRIALSLGITQAAVNKYLSDKCSASISKLGKAAYASGLVNSMLEPASVVATAKLNGMIDRTASGKAMIELVGKKLGIKVAAPA